MHPIAKIIIAASLVGGTVVLGIYRYFGKGLATRIFATVTPLLVFAVITGHVVGYAGTTVQAVGIGLVIGLSTLLPVMLRFHRSLVGHLENQVSVLATSTAQLSATAKEAAALAAQQAATVAEIMATLEELQQTSAVTAATARQVSDAALESSARGAEGFAASNRAQAVLELIAQVTELVESVRDFADQSNLLAVSASIEAAKAGEHGRGFSIVAAEVRSLAEQSKQAAHRIRVAVSGADEGKRALEGANVSLTRLATMLDESTEQAFDIATTADQEAAGVRQIAEAMNSVAEAGTANAEAARQLEQAVDAVGEVTDSLRRFING